MGTRLVTDEQVLEAYLCSSEATESDAAQETHEAELYARLLRKTRWSASRCLTADPEGVDTVGHEAAGRTLLDLAPDAKLRKRLATQPPEEHWSAVAGYAFRTAEYLSYTYARSRAAAGRRLADEPNAEPANHEDRTAFANPAVEEAFRGEVSSLVPTLINSRHAKRDTEIVRLVLLDHLTSAEIGARVGGSAANVRQIFRRFMNRHRYELFRRVALRLDREAELVRDHGGRLDDREDLEEAANHIRRLLGLEQVKPAADDETRPRGCVDPTISRSELRS